MGGAVAGADCDPTLACLNPSTAFGAAASSLTLGGQRGYIGDVSWHALGVFPVSSGGSLVAGGAWYDAGSVTLRPSGAPPRTVSAQRDLMGLVGAAAGVNGIRIGFSAKLMNSTLLDEFTSNAVAYDAGIEAGLWGGLSAGVLLQNMGGGIRFEKEDVPLASTLRAGFSGVWPDGGDRLAVFGDMVRDLERRKNGWGGGVEYRWSGTLSFRVGGGERPEGSGIGLTFGMGFEGGSFRLDYASRLEVSEAPPQILALTFIL